MTQRKSGEQNVHNGSLTVFAVGAGFGGKSRMSGDVHVRFREHPRGKFPRVTRQRDPPYVESKLDYTRSRLVISLTSFSA